MVYLFEASRGVGARQYDCKRDCTPSGFDFHSGKLNILHFYFFALAWKQRATLSSENREQFFLNTRFPLRTLLCAGYSVKLIILCNVK